MRRGSLLSGGKAAQLLPTRLADRHGPANFACTASAADTGHVSSLSLFYIPLSSPSPGALAAESQAQRSGGCSAEGPNRAGEGASPAGERAPRARGEDEGPALPLPHPRGAAASVQKQALRSNDVVHYCCARPPAAVSGRRAARPTARRSAPCTGCSGLPCLPHSSPSMPIP